MTGGCLCGAVRYRVTGALRPVIACHCSQCRRTSGHHVAATSAPRDTVAVTGNVTWYASSDVARRGFCGVCGSNLFWRLTMPGPMQGMMSVTAGTLDSLEGLELTAEVYIDAKPAGHAFAGERQRMTEADVMAMVGASK